MIILVAVMLLVGVLVVGLVFMLALRSWTFAEARTEARLRSSDTPTVSYVVPHGQDPVLVMTALTHEGFVSVPDMAGGVERLLIECPEADRGRVRRVIEQVNRTGFDGTAMHAGRVRFADETEAV
ncbi:MAG: hypothetical protein ACRDQD_27030 [Nocardioidaceae bacterium]